MNKTLIADKMIGVRRGYRRGICLKLKRVASTSSITASLLRDSLVLDSELRDLFSQTQSYLAATH
ncbi:hypothetical protein PanWU01x14_368120 [Parasponia andersonii]|uniref:Uncharacterized protein n=1 Tax=Parasponia andersonii TaxID=3476 RepID=A0A2P5A580_PARAD|nr:hypothetical protein PanWU01x14_368120 [Parasponia andersonii]